MRYDIHTHALHPKVAPKVLAHLEAHYHITPVGNGLMEDLLEREKKAGVDRFVVHTAATAPAQVIPANNWALSLKQDHPEVVAFGTLHPDYADWRKELDRLRRNGIRGLKFHPEFQGFWMDDPKLLPILEEAWRDFIFMFHAGDRLPPKGQPLLPLQAGGPHGRLPQSPVHRPAPGRLAALGNTPSRPSSAATCTSTPPAPWPLSATTSCGRYSAATPGRKSSLAATTPSSIRLRNGWSCKNGWD